MTTSETFRSEWVRPLVLLWRLAPAKMRRRIVTGLVFRALQSLCLAGVFGTVALWSLLLASGRETSTAALVWTSAAATALLLAQFCFAHMSVRHIWLTSFRLVGMIRLRLLSHLLRLPLAFHLSRHKGDLANVLTGDLALVENLLTDGLPRLVQSFALPLFVLLMICALDWVTAALALLPLLAALPLLVFSCRRLASLSATRQQAQAGATSQVLQWVEGMATVRAFALLDRQRHAFMEPLSDIHRISVRMVASLTVPLLGFGAIVMSGLALIVAVAGYRHGAGDLSTGRLVAILLLSWPLCSPLMGLAQFLELAAIAKDAIRRLNNIIAVDPAQAAGATETASPNDSPQPKGHAVTFEAVAFHHVPGRNVLQNVGFQLPEHGLTAIVGPSGAGKTTTLALLSGLLQPTQGRVLIGGVDTRSIEPATLGRLVSIAFQDVRLFAGSIRENIAMGNPRASQQEIEQAAASIGAHAFISALPQGYETQVGESGIALSGGERQRISLARALLKNTPILLIDEGTASVDAQIALTIEKALKTLSETRTIIVVTHRQTTADMADRTIVIGDEVAP